MSRAAHAVALAGLVGAGLVAAPSCTRHADLRDEPDADLIDPDPVVSSGPVPPVNGAISGTSPPCAGRPFGACQGPVDFPCRFAPWATDVARSCQVKTGCETNGRVEVTMNEDGCVDGLAMDEPGTAIVACLVEALGDVKCPCGEGKVSYFYGLANDGICR
jgi:hypothetical protein